MKTEQLMLRCFGEQKGDQWTVVCVDLCLAAEASTIEKAKAKLESQIKEYLFDALVGEDKPHAAMLLSRKAPLSLRAKYHYIALISRIVSAKNHVKSILFTETLPLKPC